MTSEQKDTTGFRWTTLLRPRWAICIFIAVLALLRLAVEFIPTRIEIGPETTVIEGPLRPDGTPDYTAYLNEQWSTGVTPENNAVVDLVRVFGPDVFSEENREAYFENLGISMPLNDVQYLTSFDQFLDMHGSTTYAGEERFSKIRADLNAARSRPWSSEEFPEIAEWIEEYRPYISEIVATSRHPRFYLPLFLPSGGTLNDRELPLLEECRDAVDLLTVEVMAQLGRGQVERACELTLAAHRLSRLVSSYPDLIGWILSGALTASAMNADQGIVLSGLLTAKQADDYRSQLAALQPHRSLASVFDSSGRFVALDSVLARHTGRLDKAEVGGNELQWWAFAPNPALRRYNALFDDIVAALAIPDPSDRLRRLREIDRRYSSTVPLHPLSYGIPLLTGTRSIVGRQFAHNLVAASMFPQDMYVAAEERTHARILIVETGYALAAYKAEHGAFPDTLDALVPDILPAVPPDPVTGDPLKYLRKDDGFLLYSVGINGVDDGGLMHWPSDADDVAFGITPEPPEEE